MENYFKSNAILDIFFNWKWHILTIMIVSIIASIVFSSPFFIHPKYRSSATLYPVNIVSLSEESASEQMLEVMMSDDIKFSIIEQYGLYSHYRIDSTKKGSLAKMMSYYEDNVRIEKTPNDAVKITVCDEDPQVATNMINSIIEKYDNLALKIDTKKSEELYHIYSAAVKDKAHVIDSLSDVLNKYRTEYGMIDEKSQIMAYGEAVLRGRSSDNINTIIKNWQEYGVEYKKTDSLLNNAIHRYNNDLRICEDACRDMNKKQSFSRIISKPYPADKKYYPKRWLIALISAFGGCLIGIIAAAFMENYKKPED